MTDDATDRAGPADAEERRAATEGALDELRRRIAALLQGAMGGAGMDRAALAAAAGIHPKRLILILAAGALPSLRELAALGLALGVEFQIRLAEPLSAHRKMTRAAAGGRIIEARRARAEARRSRRGA